MVRIIIIATSLGFLFVILYITIKFLDKKIPGEYKNDKIKANKVKDNTEEIQPLAIKAKKKNLLSNTALHELRKQVRVMNPPPASGMAISGANMETLINWLIVNGKWNGQGTLTYSDGRKYVGEFKNDKWIGQVTLTYSDGRKYVSEFKKEPEPEIIEIETEIVKPEDEKELGVERLTMIREEKIKKRVELRKMKELEA